VREQLRQALRQQATVHVPVVVLAETLRGGPRDAPVNRVLKATGSVPTDPDTGRMAGVLLGRTGGHNVADALVAAECAAVPGSVLLTSDPDDLGALLVDEPVTVVRV
jgi:predicted nucleic acid-binding protein